MKRSPYISRRTVAGTVMVQLPFKEQRKSEQVFEQLSSTEPIKTSFILPAVSLLTVSWESTNFLGLLFMSPPS
jgi:hypothetical protein